MLEDEIAGWHHRCNELGQTPGGSEGQGSLVCCSPWDGKESDTTEQQQNVYILTPLLGFPDDSDG